MSIVIDREMIRFSSCNLVKSGGSRDLCVFDFHSMSAKYVIPEYVCIVFRPSEKGV